MVAEAVERPLAKGFAGKNLRIPLFTKIKTRNLYVSQMLSALEVAKATGLTSGQVYQLAHREGWTKLRKETALRVAKSADARASADVDALIEEIANDTAELSLGTLAKSKETLMRSDEDAARDLQAYSQAAKNFVGLYRQAKSLDVAAQQGNTTNVLFISCPRAGDAALPSASAPAKPEPINVTPVSPAVTQPASEA